jgi:hypothetical protein
MNRFGQSSNAVARNPTAEPMPASRRDEPDFDPRTDVSFVIVSCDRYQDLWQPFFSCMDRHWADCPFPVYLVTNEAPFRRSGVSVIHVGPDRDYASNLITAVSAVPTPWVILWLEDLVFTGRVDTERLLSIVTEAVAAGAGYLKLTTDAPLSFEDEQGQRIGAIPTGVRYRSAIGTALYRKDTLLQLLVPGLSAWELDRSDLSNRLPEPFMALTVREARKPIMPLINTVIKGEWYRPAVPFLRREGFAALLPGRRRQSLWQYLYIQLYLVRIGLYRALRRHWYD